MFYATRDSRGNICDIHTSPQNRAEEALPADDPEALRFLRERWRQHEMSKLDLDFVRAIEDTIELLIAKGIILFTDLPPPVQEKLLRRKEIRGQTHFGGKAGDDIVPI